MTVQELIDLLNRVEDKSQPVAVWLNSTVPESKYHPDDRLSIVHVDNLTKEGFPCIDICCQPYPDPVENDDQQDSEDLEEAKKNPFRIEAYADIFKKYGIKTRYDQQHYLEIVIRNNNLLIDKATMGLYWRGTSEVHGLCWWLEQAIQHKITKDFNYVRSR